jgi:hypothetical protein
MTLRPTAKAAPHPLLEDPLGVGRGGDGGEGQGHRRRRPLGGPARLPGSDRRVVGPHAPPEYARGAQARASLNCTGLASLGLDIGMLCELLCGVLH